MKMILRNLRLGDWQYFKKWWHDRELIGLTSGRYEEFADTKLKKSVSDMMADQKATHRMIEADGQTVGHINAQELSKTKAELQIVIGEKEYWSQGIGFQAAKQFIDETISPKYSKLYIEVRPENTRAVALYKKLGFQVAGEKKYHNKYLPVVVTMERVV